MGRSILVAALALALAGCAAPGATVFATGPGSSTPDGLRRVRWSELGNEWLRPGTSLASYSGVVLTPIQVSYHTQQGQAIDPTATPYVPGADEIAAIERDFQESFARALSGGAFKVVAGPGPGVLRVSGRVVDLTRTVPQWSSLAPDENVGSNGFGQMTLLLELADATSGRALMRTAARLPIALDPNQAGANDDPTMLDTAIRQAFSHEARLLRQSFDQLRSAPAPAAP